MDGKDTPTESKPVVSKPHISVVSMIYRSGSSIEEFVEQTVTALAEIDCSNYEIILVNDGSPDNSRQLILDLKRRYNEIILIDLSRNFGHHYAASAGLAFSSGELVFMLDCDLEVSPSVLTQFYQEFESNEYSVVYGYQERRSGGFFRRLSGDCFWWLLNTLSDTTVPKNLVTARLMSRQYVDALREMGDRNLFLAGMMYWVGFSQKGIPVVRNPRSTKSSYSFRKRANLLIEAVASFSTVPLDIIFSCGIGITIVTFLATAFLILYKLMYPQVIYPGWSSVIVVLCFSIGILTSFLGVVGIYLGKIYNQVRDRPLYIVENIYR